MGRRLLAIVGAVALAAALSIPAQAQSNEPLVFVVSTTIAGHHTADPVDYLTWCGDCVGTDWTTGSPWVVNPHDSWPYFLPTYGEAEPGCMWDSDDSYSWTGNGGEVLAAGAAVGITECRYSGDINPCCPELLTDIGIRSPSSALIVTERWDWDTGSVSHTIAPVFDTSDHKWHYFGCIRSPGTPGSPLTTIPNSHGGVGTPQLITVTVTNPTSQKIGKTGGFIESGVIHGDGRGCTAWVAP